MFTIIFAQKNRYISWTGKLDDRPILKNLDGMSIRYPKWIKEQIQKIATNLVTNHGVDWDSPFNPTSLDLLMSFSGDVFG